MNYLLDAVRQVVRKLMGKFARELNSFSNGKITPDMVTFTGLAAHVLITYLLATRHPIWAAGLLVIFGLFDTLDGELARLQKKDSAKGMLLDATTDRIKEVLLYVGAAYFFVVLDYPFFAVWAVAACGASLCVSYVKAKGETAVRNSHLSPNQINRIFQDGLARFEVRMFLFVVGLVTALLPEMLILITILSTFTVFSRLIKINRSI